MNLSSKSFFAFQWDGTSHHTEMLINTSFQKKVFSDSRAITGRTKAKWGSIRVICLLISVLDQLRFRIRRPKRTGFCLPYNAISRACIFLKTDCLNFRFRTFSVRFKPLNPQRWQILKEPKFDINLPLILLFVLMVYLIKHLLEGIYHFNLVSFHPQESSIPFRPIDRQNLFQ